MITINLLPEEKRYKERTPLPRFLLLNAAIIICALLIIWNVVLFMKLSNKDVMLREIQANLGKLQVRTSDYEKKVNEEKKLSEWSKAVASVTQTRPFVWWESVDQLLDLLSNSPTVWITSLRGEETTGKQSGKVPVAYVFNFGCLSATDDVAKMTDFRIKLRHHPQLSKTFDIGFNDLPHLIKVAMPEYQEEFALKFEFEMQKSKQTQIK